MSGLSLYDLSGRLYELLNRSAMDDELTQEELDEQYDALSIELQRKSTGVIGYYRNVESMITAADTEIKRLQALKERATRHLDNYKRYIKECMEHHEISEIQTDIGKLRIAKNPISIEIKDIEKVPDEYVKTTLTIKTGREQVKHLISIAECAQLDYQITDAADKTGIKDHFKITGEILPGTWVQTDNTRLDIK